MIPQSAYSTPTIDLVAKLGTGPAEENNLARLARAQDGQYCKAPPPLDMHNPLFAVQGCVCCHPRDAHCNRLESRDLLYLLPWPQSQWTLPKTNITPTSVYRHVYYQSSAFRH